MEIFNPHDKFFKETFSIRENVIDFLQGTIPEEILKKLDLSTLTLDNNSYIDEELKEHFSDVVYTCFSKSKELTIALLFEHKSYPETCPYLQLLRYLLKIWETNIKQTERLQPVIPVILYHGKEVWKVRRFSGYFEEEEGLKFLESVIRYLYSSTEIGVDKVVNTIKEISGRGGELVMTTAMKLIEKGKMEGKIEGKLEGKIEGLKEAIELGLELKYGVEGLRLLERINNISLAEKLETIKEAVKISKSMEEIERLL